MNIIKKIFNFKKENNEEIVKETENNDDGLKQEKIEEKKNNEKLLNIEKNINKEIEYKITEIQNRLNMKKSINIETKNIVEKVEKILNERKVDNIEELINEIDNILIKEKNKSKKIKEKKLEEQKNKRELEKKIEVCKKICVKVSECSGIKVSDVNENIMYESFLNSIGHIYIEKIKDILADIEYTQLKNNLYTKLDNMYIEYEVEAKNLVSKVANINDEINVITKEVEEFTNEVKNFTIYLNKINAKGKIELKQQYEKLKRARQNLVNKEKTYVKKEEVINEKILDINKVIISNISKFNKIYEYILIYIEEEIEGVEKDLSTFTKEENMFNEFENNKQSIELLTDLKHILKN